MTWIEVPGTDLDSIRDQAEQFAALAERQVIAALREATARFGNIGEAVIAQGAPQVITEDDLNSLPQIWIERVSAQLLPWLGRAVTAGVFAQVAAINAVLGRIVIAAFDELIITRVILEGTENRLVGIGNEIWEQARRELAAGIALGESIPKLTKRVRATANVSAVRATAIARTEVIGASNKSSLEVMRATGLVAQKRWIATFDSRVRLTHIEAHGQTVPLSGAFVIGGAQLDHPGDFSGPADEVINCRCALGYVVDEDVAPGNVEDSLAAAVTAKFDPTQPRDEDGKWTDEIPGISIGLPDDIFATPVKVQDGEVVISAKPNNEGRVTLTIADRSVDLDGKDLRELQRTISAAKYDDESRASSDGVYRVVRINQDEKKSDILISLRPVKGAYVTEEGKRIDDPEDAPERTEVYNAEYDLVINEGDESDFDDEPSIRVDLKDIDSDGRKSIYSVLDRATAARRIDTGNRPVDVFAPRAGAVGLRVENSQNGGTTELILNARAYRRTKEAVTDVLWGDDDDDQDYHEAHDISKTVETSEGKLNVRFNGRAMRDSDDGWEGTLTVIPEGDPVPWNITVDGPYIDDFYTALSDNGAVAGLLDI